MKQLTRFTLLLFSALLILFGEAYNLIGEDESENSLLTNYDVSECKKATSPHDATIPNALRREACCSNVACHHEYVDYNSENVYIMT